MAAHAPKLCAEPDPPDPIAELIRRDERRDAIAECARRHGAALGRLCMALLGSQADAEEALQDTLVAAHDGLGSYRGEGTVRAWLCGIARHVCARRLERRARRERHLASLEVGSPAPAADELLEARRLATSLRLALERLAPSERETLLLRYQADLSFRAIAQALGIDEATARKRASRALVRLRSVLSEGRP
jgi:RNA polymerase sigma-70 factor (ECF subfamily)